MYRKALTITAIAMALVAVTAGVGWWLLSGWAEGYYYVQVDNTKTKELEPTGGFIDPTGGMSLSYTLPAFDKEGAGRELSFGTERELREDAYLRLTVVPIRGVVEWMEVQPEDIPAKAQEHLVADH